VWTTVQPDSLPVAVCCESCSAGVGLSNQPRQGLALLGGDYPRFMADTNEGRISVKVRLIGERDEHAWIGNGPVVGEKVREVELPPGQYGVSLDELESIAFDFMRDVHSGAFDIDTPAAYSIRVESHMYSQGSSGGFVTLVLDLMSERLWGLFDDLLAAYVTAELFRRYGPKDDD
jgi:hypothetical protein